MIKPWIPKPEDIIAVQIYLEKRRSRIYVGTLTQEEKAGKTFFRLTYDAKYLANRAVIPLGPELPLTKEIYESPTLFPSFQDRIPSKENPAYPDYCRMMGIPVEEQNLIILLATIGRRGPSSFIYEPLYKNHFSGADLKAYRQALGLTIREFAAVFDISYSHLQRIENNKFSGKEILKRMEILHQFPEIALYEILKYGAVLHTSKKKKIIKMLQERAL